MPARKDIPSEMVMQVDETGRDHTMCIDEGFIRWEFHMRADRDDLALADEDRPVFDDAVGSDQGPAQCVSGGRRLRQ